MDSGATRSVIQMNSAKSVAMRETVASKNGMHYRAANGTIIFNYGAKAIAGTTDDSHQTSLNMDVADVLKPMGSIDQFTENGNRVVFEKGGGYVEHVTTGKRTELRTDGRQWKMRVWIPIRNDEKGKGSGTSCASSETVCYACAPETAWKKESVSDTVRNQERSL